ncbi:MAG: TolC family protein [Deltaproteobacteria bacterium]|nr:TolC family protein [Deltaproteobacteria bacterium]
MARKNKNLKRSFLAPAIVSLLLFAPHFTAPSMAGGPVSLKELLGEARGNNPELKAYGERAEAMEARVSSEGALEDPTFRVELMELSKDRPLDITPGNASQTKYIFNQSIPFPGKLSLKENIALKEAYAARSEFRSKEQQVSREVKEAYFDYAYLAESIRITEEIKGVLSNMARIAEAKYSTGLASQQDVIKVNVELTSLTNETITLEAEKDVAAARLKSLLNRDQDSPLGEPVGLTREKVKFDTRELMERAARKNPEIRAVEFEAEANEHKAELAKRDYYPDFMVGAGPVEKDGRFESFDVMFQVTIPLWRSKYDSRSREAASNARSLRSRLAAGKNAKGFEVKGAALRVEAADRMRVLYETGLMPQVELSLESALKNYRAGKVDFLTLLDTERELKKTRLDYLKIILDYRKRVAALENAVGEDLLEYASEDIRDSAVAGSGALYGGPR